MNTPSPFPNSFTIPSDSFQTLNTTFTPTSVTTAADLFPGTNPNITSVDLEGVNALWDSQTPVSETLGGPMLDLGAYPPYLDSTWTFICTPDEISWTTSNAVNRVEMFGTNNPPAISGTKGMREFSLNNALVEGFTRNKKVEAKVQALEDLLNYKSSLSGGYVNVPVYQLWANQKGYGKQAFFLMKSVQVKEKMRDLAGDATRAFVDVTFVEVPAFQVDSGIDQAPFSQQGKNSDLLKIGLNGSEAQLEAARNRASVQGQAQAQVPETSGASVPSATPAQASR